jgi:hypothetical protein
MVGSERSVLHGDRGFCSDAGSGLLGQAPAELCEQQLLIRLRLGVAGEHQLAAVGGEMHVEELHGGELLEYDAWGQSRRSLLEELFKCDLQTVGDEGDEDVRFDAFLVLMMDRADRQIPFELFECVLDFG